MALTDKARSTPTIVDVAEQAGVQRGSMLVFEPGLGVVQTVVDGSQGLSNSLPAIWAATHPAFRLLRLHGRNTETWSVKGATATSDRFNHDYPDAELNDIAGKVARLALLADSTHVVFNNNMEDQGQRNVSRSIRLLQA